jgi:hypothetical protein
MSTREWVSIHRKHHARSDTLEDPHSPQIHGIRKVLFEGTELYRMESRNAATIARYGRGTPDDWIERKLYAKHGVLGPALTLAIDLMLFGPIGLTVWAVRSGRVALVDTRAPDLSIDEVVHLLISEIRRLAASRVVIDSLSGFELALALTFREDFRESLLRLVTALAGAGVTAMLTSELEDRYTDLRFSPYGTAFLTDAIIVQRCIELDSRLLRVMAVVKVRSRAHSDELRLFSIDDEGIRVGERLAGQEGLLGGRPTRTSGPGELRPVAGADGDA